MPFRQHVSFIFILGVFCLMGCFWKELDGHTTGTIVVLVLSSSTFSSEPGPPSSSSDGLLPLPPSTSFDPPSPPSSPSSPSHASPPSAPSGSYQPPGSPSSPSDGQLPSPPSSSSGVNPPSPPSGSYQPPGSPSSPSDGQLPSPPSSSSGVNPPSPPSGSYQPPGSPSSPSDGQLPSPPSSSSGANPPSPPSGGQYPPGSPSSPSSSPGANPPSPPYPPSPGSPPSPPGSPSSPSSSPGANPPSPPYPPSPGSPPSPPGSPSSPSSSPGASPPSPPYPPSPGSPPSPPVLPPSHVSPPSPPSGGGADSGGNQSVSTATSAFTTVPSLTGPDLNSYLLGSLRPKCSSGEIHTDDLIGPQWDEQIRLLAERCEYQDTFTLYSCKNRCGVQERDVSLGVIARYLPRCYCDQHCDDFGDCCFDFDTLCRAHVSPQKNPLTSDQICLAVKKGIGPTYTGYIAWKTCPQNWTEKSVRQKCQEEDQSDVLSNLPVFDFDSLVTYRNIFCARCNGALNTGYWTLQLSCGWFNVTNFNFTSDRYFLSNYNCSIEISPREYLLRFSQRCVPRFQDCYSISQKKNESYCQTECLRYAFPVCFDTGKIRFRNPQCGLCNGFGLSDLECKCISGGSPGNPSLTILFDFASTSMSVKVYDRQESETHNVEQFWSCSSDEVYDPYTGSCKPIVSPGRYDHRRNETQKEILNCTFIAFNKTDYIQLPNGSVYLKPHNKIYGNATYTIHGNGLLLCGNFSRDFTTTEKGSGNGYLRKKTPASLQLLTLIGCIVSIISLILLVFTYILFAELRNLPGKIIINLGLSLLLYQSVLFSAVKNDDPDVCLAIAVLLHFFVLSSFTWMNVMAYDVHRIFTPSDGVAVNRQGNYKKRLLQYCLYAWGTPALVVLLCVAVDHVKKGSIGYGQGADECFISQSRALLLSFVLPVALLMVFNLFALGHIVIHIVKTRKETQQVTNQRQGGNVAVICVKMASVMGVTWILGIAANLKPLSFLWYPYVVLNSLQGLFIFLSFAVSGRALELYRSKVADILKKLRTKRENNKQSGSGCNAQSANTSSGTQGARQIEDTSL